MERVQNQLKFSKMYNKEVYLLSFTRFLSYINANAVIGLAKVLYTTANLPGGSPLVTSSHFSVRKILG